MSHRSILLSIQDKDLRDLARTAITQGWTLARSGSHMRWTNPQGLVVFTACTPGGNRSVKNHRSELKRKGLVL